VVPVSSWLVDGEGIGEVGANWNGALSDTSGTIHRIGAILEETVEMQRDCLVTKLVGDIDNNTVAFGDTNFWDGPLAVDAHYGPRKTIGAGSDPTHLKIVGNGSCMRQSWQRKQHRKDWATHCVWSSVEMGWERRLIRLITLTLGSDNPCARPITGGRGRGAHAHNSAAKFSRRHQRCGRHCRASDERSAGIGAPKGL